MPRGAKRDITATKNLYESGFLHHPDSFISLDGHLFLKSIDKSRVRPFVFSRFKNKCVVCGTVLHPEAQPFTPRCGDWHHVRNCDCVGCAELRCDVTTGRNCHAHRTIGFDREAEKQKAKQDFQKLYPEDEPK